MPTNDRLERARDVFWAFSSGDRAAVERYLSDDFSFSSPLDVGLDRAGYFERCWPGAGLGQDFEFVRLVESGDEVIVTYGVTIPTAKRAGTPRSSRSEVTRCAPPRCTSAGM
jgi:hypothetical protein